MKIILTLVLAVCFTPSAGAQNNTQPAPAEAPAKLIPEGTPAQPSQVPPAQPTTDKPAMPSTDKPAQQGVITKQEPTTPAVLAAPADTFFRPFTPAATAQIAAPAQPETIKPAATAQIAAPAQPGTVKAAAPVRTNVNPVLALKKQQARELKALRVKLKTRPNAEINKAVAAMQADHKTAITALEAANKAEAEKDQKVRSKQVKKANNVMLTP
jgi:Skp family chaperone for outer membrane proteins